MQPFEEETISGVDGLPSKPVKAYIEEAIDRSMEEMLLTAPIRTIAFIGTTGSSIGNTNYQILEIGSKMGLKLGIPNDYLRFKYADAYGWKRNATKISDEKWRARQLFDYSMTTNEYPCVFEERETRSLYLFPYNKPPEGGQIAYISYVKKYDYRFGGDDYQIETYLNEPAVTALIYSVAMKVLVYFGRDASGMAALYKAAMLSAEKN